MLLLLLVLTVGSGYANKSLRTMIFENELTSLQCDIHDFEDTYTNEFKTSPFHKRTVAQITSSWQSTFPDGNYQSGTKNTIPYSQLNLRDSDTILRIAEYQAMVYCKSNAVGSSSSLSAITSMSSKNLRVGEFTLEATGFDQNQNLFWYIASNVAQKSILLVHRGTSKTNSDDVLDDLVRLKITNVNGLFNKDFPYLASLSSKDLAVDIGFYQRFQDQKTSIVAAVRLVLARYSQPSYSFIVVGHSLGAAWAFLNAAHFVSLDDINPRMTAIYTFGQPLLGSLSFVDAITAQLNAPKERYVRVVNRNDLIPHLGCSNCVQPTKANEKWVVNTNTVNWRDCQGGYDLSCSLGISCRSLSWSNHSAVALFSMRGEFCQIASNRLFSERQRHFLINL